jgi:hypothetical protein
MVNIITMTNTYVRAMLGNINKVLNENRKYEALNGALIVFYA